MVADYERLVKAIVRHINPGEELKGDLGYTVNGAFHVVDVDDPKKFYVRFAEGTFVSAYHNNNVVQIPNLPVLVGTDSNNRPTIISTDPDRITQFNSTNGGSNVGLHSHVRNGPMPYITDTWLLKQLRMEVVSGYTVKVRPGPYLFDRKLRWFLESTIDLSMLFPVDAGYSCWIVIGINPQTNSLTAMAGPITFASNTGDPADIPSIPFVESGYILIGAVFALGGDVQLYDFNIEDLRFSIGPMMSYLENLYNVSGYSNLSGYVLGYELSGQWTGVPQTGTGGSGDGGGGSPPAILLDYDETADIAVGISLTSGTWTDIGSNHNFTVVDAAALVGLSIGGSVVIGGTGGEILSRLVIDSGGTPIIKELGGGNVQGSIYQNVLSGAPLVEVLGLSSGVHTVKLQVVAHGTGLTAYCRAASGNESLHISVVSIGSGPAGPTGPAGADGTSGSGEDILSDNKMLSSMYIPESGERNIVSEVGAWVNYGGNPLFGGSGAASAQEPSVIIENGLFKMWYTEGSGGGVTTHIDYTTSPDGLTWTDHGTVLGNGGSGYSGRAEHASVVKFDGIYYIYFATDNGSEINRSTSVDGITWTTPIQVIAANQEPTYSNGWDNTYVWREGDTWLMLLDGVGSTDSIFKTTLARSSDHGLSWVFDGAEWLDSLALVTGGSTGGMFMMTPPKRDGLYHQWYQPATIAANTPTVIYHATSPDLITWTILPGPSIPLPGGSYDQVADPAIVEFGGKTYLFYEQVINATSTFEICVAIFNGTISQLIDGVVPAGSLATSSIPGLVKPDNISLQVDGDGVLSVIANSFPVYAPLVSGDLPGPTPIASADGQFIMIRIV